MHFIGQTKRRVEERRGEERRGEGRERRENERCMVLDTSITVNSKRSVLISIKMIH